MLNFKACLKERNLEIVIEIATDETNFMAGKVNSLSTLLRNGNPELTLVRCVCHSLHLATNKAAELVPTVITFIIRETHTWFFTNPKRSRVWQDIYETLEKNIFKKILGLVAIHWLSRLDAINAIIEQ